MNNLRFVRGTYKEYKDKLQDLFKDHANEIVTYATKELELKIDDDFYTNVEQSGNYLSLAFLDGEELIGYLSVFINRNHPHHKDKCFAMTDVFYIKPSKRGLASFKLLTKAFDELEFILKEEYNADYLYISTSAKKELTALVDYIGCKRCDIVYVKNLKSN